MSFSVSLLPLCESPQFESKKMCDVFVPCSIYLKKSINSKDLNDYVRPTSTAVNVNTTDANQ